MGHSQGQVLVQRQSVANADINKLSIAISDASKSLAITTSDIDKEALAVGTWQGALIRKLENPTGVIKDKFKDVAGASATVANLKKASRDLLTVSEELVSFNVSQLSASFADVQFKSLKMGMSFSDTVKFLHENQRTLALYGSQGFNQLTDQLGASLKQFGYTSKQSAEIIGPGIEAAISAGIDIKSPDALNKFITDTANEFRDMAGVLGETTLPQIMKMNAELANNQDISSIMVGLNQEQAQAYRKSLESQRSEIMTRGMNIEQAQELIKLQEAAKHQTVSTRIGEAGKALALASRLGMGAEGLEAYRIMLKGATAGKEESAQLTEFLQKLGVAQHQAVMNAPNLQAQFAQEISGESGPLGQYKQTMETGTKQEMLDRANAGQTPEGMAAAKLASKPSAIVAEFGTITNQISNAMDNNLLKAIFSSTTGLAGLTWSSIRLMETFSLMSGVSGLKSLLPGVAAGIPIEVAETGLLAGAGKFAGNAGMALAKGGGAYLAGSMFGGGADVMGYKKTGALLHILGDAGAGALTGFQLSVGNPYGALIGGLAGAGVGLYNNWGNMVGSSPVTPGNSQSDNQLSQNNVNNSAEPSSNKTVGVEDLGAQAQLSQIADALGQAVTLLQKMSENAVAPFQGSSLKYGKIPSVVSVQTGTYA